MFSRPCPITPPAGDHKLFCFGYGYTAAYLAEALRPFGWKIAGTTTDADKRDALRADGIEAYLFDGNHPIADPVETFDGVTHLLFSIPPGATGDAAFELHAHDLTDIPHLVWAGYLSTTGVYGNQDGGWVDENTVTAPTSKRGSQRELAEQQWTSLHINNDFPLHIFRLSGIYGPGRSAIDSVRSGTARRIDKPDHVFNRIHVEDIVQTLIASMNKPNPGGIYNLADDHPTPSHETITFACNLLGLDVPPMIPFAQADVAPMVRSFYSDNKRVKNDRIKSELGITLLYPDYRDGLQACLAIEEEVDGLMQD
jgi:nucleoside-diphosphate-sugar epimerase